MQVEGQASLKEGVAQISEHIVSHGDIIQGLRSDHVDTFRSLEERFKHSKEEKGKLQAALAASQAALTASQQAEAKTKQALQTASNSLMHEQAKNKRQAFVLCQKDKEIAAKDFKIHGYEQVVRKYQLAEREMKAKLDALQSTQILHQNVDAIKMRIEWLGPDFMAKINAMQAQTADLATTMRRMETKQDVTFAGEAAGSASRKRHRSQTPADEEEEEVETQERAFARE